MPPRRKRTTPKVKAKKHGVASRVKAPARLPKKKNTPVKRKRKPGRPFGSKDRIPRAACSTFRAVMEEVRDENGRDIKTAYLNGLRGGPAYADKYLKLFRDSIDGPPATNVNVSQTFKEDELASAQRELTRKMDALFKTAVATEVVPPVPTSDESSQQA